MALLGEIFGIVTTIVCSLIFVFELALLSHLLKMPKKKGSLLKVCMIISGVVGVLQIVSALMWSIGLSNSQFLNANRVSRRDNLDCAALGGSEALVAVWQGLYTIVVVLQVCIVLQASRGAAKMKKYSKDKLALEYVIGVTISVILVVVYTVFSCFSAFNRRCYTTPDNEKTLDAVTHPTLYPAYVLVDLAMLWFMVYRLSMLKRGVSDNVAGSRVDDTIMELMGWYYKISGWTIVALCGGAGALLFQSSFTINHPLGWFSLCIMYIGYAFRRLPLVGRFVGFEYWQFRFKSLDGTGTTTSQSASGTASRATSRTGSNV